MNIKRTRLPAPLLTASLSAEAASGGNLIFGKQENLAD